MRFAVDSNDAVYITSPNQQTRMAPKGSETFSPVLWAGSEIYARQLICERVKSSILQVVFPTLSLDGDAECIWALFDKHIVLYHVSTDWPMHISSPDSSSDDGPVLVSPQGGPYSASFTISDATTFLRLKSCLVILEQNVTFRLLDLETWRLRTLVTFDSPTYSIYPANGALSLPFSESEERIILEDEGAVYLLDLKTGKTSSSPQLSLHGHRYDSIFPIPSSRHSPTYIVRKGNAAHLLRIANGVTQKIRFELTQWGHAAHVSSTGFTLKTRPDPSPSFAQYGYELAWQPHQEPAPDRLLPFDLSSLINNELFLNDLNINHGSQKWSLPLDLVTDLHPSFKRSEFCELIKTLPSTSVDALIGRILGKPLLNAPSVESCRIWSHAIYAWRAIDAGNNPVLKDFKSSVIPSLPDHVACNALIIIWNDENIRWAVDDPFILSLTRQVKKQYFKMFSALLLSQHSARNMELSLSMVELLVEDSEVSALEDHVRGLTAIHLEKTPFPKSDVLETLLAKPTDFMFSLKTAKDPYVVIGDTRYLYTRWKWFKRLMDFGGEETKNRTAKMPDWMSMNVLRSILGYVHEEWFDKVLSVSDALVLLEHRHEFDICDADDKPIAPFEGLYSYYMDVVFHKVTRHNVLEQIANCQRLGMKSKVLELFAPIISREYEIGALDLVEALSSQSLALLKEETVRLQALA